MNTEKMLELVKTIVQAEMSKETCISYVALLVEDHESDLDTIAEICIDTYRTCGLLTPETFTLENLNYITKTAILSYMAGRSVSMQVK